MAISCRGPPLVVPDLMHDSQGVARFFSWRSRSDAVCPIGDGKTLACLPARTPQAAVDRYGCRSRWSRQGKSPGSLAARAMTAAASWPCTWPRRGKSLGATRSEAIGETGRVLAH